MLNIILGVQINMYTIFIIYVNNFTAGYVFNYLSSNVL